MTSNEINTLKEWMLHEFARQDARMTTIEAHVASTDETVAGMRATVTAMDVKLTGIDGVVERLERSVKPIEDLATVVNRGKVWWGTIAAVIVFLQLLARSLPKLPWPW